MSGTLPSTYTAPVDFRISQTPPNINNLYDMNTVTADIYAAIQQLIHTFIDIGGIGPQPTNLWPFLNGDARTLTEGNTRRFICRATQDIIFGSIISLVGGADGKVHARLASASSASTVADGYCSQPNGILSGQLGEVTLGCGVILLTGVVPGQRYWTGVVPGVIQDAPPTAAGNIEQYLGVGIDSGHFWLQGCGMWLQH